MNEKRRRSLASVDTSETNLDFPQGNVEELAGRNDPSGDRRVEGDEEANKDKNANTNNEWPIDLVAESLMNELVRLRKKRKIGQEPIAKAIGVSQSRISQMENTKVGVTLDAVLIYARAIGAEILIVPENSTRKKKLG